LINVVKLAYADFNCTDLQAMKNYYEEVIGFTTVEIGDEQEVYLSSGVDHHNIVLRQSSESELSTMGYQIDPNLSLVDVQKYLKQHGISSEIKTDYSHGIKELIELKDTDGYNLHLFREIEMPAPGFKKGHVSPYKLGHIALGSFDAQKAVDFYQTVLGFHYTDKIQTRATFLTCNADHHTLNISTFGHKMMHHIAFELKDASHHVLSADHLAQHNISLEWGPFRHTAGHNMASYHYDPEKNVIELYSDMDQFIPELGIFDPRPWHKTLPLRPQVWPNNCVWYEDFERNITDIVLGKLKVNN